jgi:hypothetical protein
VSRERKTPDLRALDARGLRPRALRPWVIGGVDYGPVIVAVTDLAAWAFDLAASDVSDWPEGQRRVASARRHVLARIRGALASGVGAEDVLFTAGLLARIFESELGLEMSEMVTILDELDLPTEVVPLRPRAQPTAEARSKDPVQPRSGRRAAMRSRHRGQRPKTRLRNAA